MPYCDDEERHRLRLLAAIDLLLTAHSVRRFRRSLVRWPWQSGG